MKKRSLTVLFVLLVFVMAFHTMSVLAAPEYLTVQNFKEIYPASGKPAEITEATNGAQITFHKVDSRVTLVGTGEDPGDDEWGRLMEFNGLVMEFSGLNFPKPTTKTNGVTLAFTFSQEAGSFYATGSTGVHIRIFSTVDGMSIYMKSAPAADTDAYYPMTGIKWERFPSKLVTKIYKSGSDYIFLFNEIECRVPADKIEMDLSRSGKCFVNIGVMGIQDRDSSLIVNRIYNDPSLLESADTQSEDTTTKAPESSNATTSVKPPVSSSTSTSADPANVSSEAPVSEITSSIDTPSVPDESQPAMTGPTSMKADSGIAIIDGANMTIKAKEKITVSEFAGAFTIDEGYEIAVFDENGVRLEDTAEIENGKTVKVLGGDQSFAEFALELMKADTGENQKDGFPVWLIIVIAAAVLVIVGVVLLLTLKKKGAPTSGVQTDEKTESDK